jgi:hypothetical protein
VADLPKHLKSQLNPTPSKIKNLKELKVNKSEKVKEKVDFTSYFQKFSNVSKTPKVVK